MAIFHSYLSLPEGKSNDVPFNHQMAGHPLEGVDREERVVSDGIGATVWAPRGRAKQLGMVENP